jgi:two-component system nitrate/nitrite response regulator NarL
MKILIADDHTLFRDALKMFIERSDNEAVVTCVMDLPGVLEVLKESPQQDIAMLDYKMPGMNGLEGLQQVRALYPNLRVALMSGFVEKEDVEAALAMGAAAYFPKTLSAKSLLKAMQLMVAGEKFVPLDFNTNEILPAYYNDDAPAQKPKIQNDTQMTPRELEVLKHLVKGVSNKEIASALGLQVVTVKLHIRGICRKLDAKNRTQAALKAQELGFVQG